MMKRIFIQRVFMPITIELFLVVLFIILVVKPDKRALEQALVLSFIEYIIFICVGTAVAAIIQTVKKRLNIVSDGIVNIVFIFLSLFSLFLRPNDNLDIFIISTFAILNAGVLLYYTVKVR